MNWDVIKPYWDYVPWALEKPGQWFAALINWAPKTSFAVAVLIAVKAYF